MMTSNSILVFRTREVQDAGQVHRQGEPSQVREVRGHGQLDLPQRRLRLLELEDPLPGQDDPYLLWLALNLNGI